MKNRKIYKQTNNCSHDFYIFFFLIDYSFDCNLLTTIPQVRVIPRPQYVFGTMSPYPTHKNVMAVSHMAFSKFECSSSWNLCINNIEEDSEQMQHKQRCGNTHTHFFVCFFFIEIRSTTNEICKYIFLK